MQTKGGLLAERFPGWAGGGAARRRWAVGVAWMENVEILAPWGRREDDKGRTPEPRRGETHPAGVGGGEGGLH